MTSSLDPVLVLSVIDQAMAGSPFYYLVLLGSLVNDGAAFLLFEGMQNIGSCLMEVTALKNR